MKKMNKVLSIILSIVMLVGLLPMAQIAELDLSGLLIKAFAAEVVNSGTCGDNLTWELADDGILTISGTGSMKNYISILGRSPWYSNRSDIAKVIINSGVETIGNYAFYRCSGITDILIAESVTSISSTAFSGCSGLKNIVMENPDGTVPTVPSMEELSLYIPLESRIQTDASNKEVHFYCIHEYGNVVQPANESLTGCEKREDYICSVCGGAYSYVKNLGHEWVLDNSVCTCIDGGLDSYHCSRCFETKSIIYAGRHNDSDNDGFCDYCLEPFGGVLDLVFCIDTTGSMGSEIAAVKNNIASYAQKLESSNIPYYIAIVDYRDFSDRAAAYDYPYSVIQDFSNDINEILAGVNKLSLGNGGDTNETVYSGLMNGLEELHWGEGSARKVILIGDAPPLDPEPNTNYELNEVCNQLNEQSVSVYTVATGNAVIEKFESIAANTGGTSFVCSDDAEFESVLYDVIDSIPESIHIHDYEATVLTEATCLQTGLVSYTCTGCGRKLNNIETPALGHEYCSEHFETGTDSYTVYTCIRNDDSYTVYDPATPVNGLNAVGVVNAIELTWQTSVEGSVTGYIIYRSLLENEGYSEVERNNARNLCTFTDMTAVVGTEYFYKVRAMKGSVEGDLCAPVSALALPDEEAPVLTSLSPASYSTLSKSITVTAAATDNVGVVRYDASYSNDDGETWVPVTSVAGSTCRFTFDTTTVSDGVILFRVLAFDAMENAGGNNKIYAYKIDNTGPEKVQNLSTVVVYPTQLTVSWERPLDEDTDHFVLQQEKEGVTTTVASTIRTLGYNISGLSPNTEYRYRVKAVDAYGNDGEYSDWLTVTTTADVTAPVVITQSNNSGAYNSSVTYTATVKDDYAVSSVSIEYSTNKTDWTQIDNFSFADGQKQVDVSKTIDLTVFDEGSLFVRAVGTDIYGNVGDVSQNAPFVEYYVDKTAPDAVAEINATVSDKSVRIKWSASSASDVASYSLYRSTSPNDGYARIAQNVKALSYTDTGVARNQTYFYKVFAVDNAGNNGVFSEYCSVTVYSDEISPEISSVSPSNGIIGPINKSVTIVASDNDALCSLTVYSKTSTDTDYTVLKSFDLSGTSKSVSFDLPFEELADGESIQLKIQCNDVAGLSSSPVFASYIVDKEAPEIADVAVSAKEGSATITWSDCSENDLSGFEIYRCDGSVTLVGKRAANTSSGRYTLTDSVTRENVRYRIDAVDRYGNRNSAYTDEVSTQIVLRASITLPDKPMAESNLVFSAGSSISAFGISSCVWQFSNGETDSGESITKTFNEAGSYSVTLTVTDIKGNTASTSKYFTVQELVRTGTLKVKVLSESGAVVRNCGVYIDLGSSMQRVLYTSSSGIVSTELSTGTHEIGAYCDGYLPKSGTVSIASDKTTEISFTLTEQNIITGDFEVHEMNFQEIVAAGIDISDPANQQIYKVTVTLIYGEEHVPVTYLRSTTEIKEYVIHDSDIQTSTTPPRYKYDIKYIPNEGNEEIIAVVRLPIKASFLKQFFMATLTIFNNADAEYRLVNCSASIPIPDGLTVMSQSPIASVIPGGSSARQTVVLRGDTPGTYSLTADFSGTLEKFNKNVTAAFTSNSFKVYGKNDVALVVEIPRHTIGQFRFNIGLENRRASAVYSPQIDIDGMVQDITSMFKKSLQEDAEYDDSDVKDLGYEGIGAFVRKADGSVTTYENCAMPVDTLEAGCGVFLEYQTVGMPADGAEGWFSKSVIECEEGFGGYVEIRYIEDNILPISEDDYINEHLRFAASSDYNVASFDFADYMHDAVKDSPEYKELAILDWGLSDVTDEIFNKLNDEIAADYISQIVDASTEDSKVELKFMKTFSGIVDHLSDMLVADEELGDKQLFKNKIDKMLKGTDYDSSTNEMLHKLLDKYISPDTLDDIYGVYDVANNISTIYHGVKDQVDGIKRLTAYASAIAAYQEVSEEIKQNLLATADKMENSRLKKALLRYANTVISEESYKAELRGMALHNFVGNVYNFYKFSYGSVLKKAIKKVTVNLLAEIIPLADAASISSDLSVAIGWISAGREALSKLSAADKQREALKLLVRLADATKASGSVLSDAKVALEANRDIDSAKAFDTAFKSYKRWNLMAYAAFEDYGNALTDNFMAKHIAKKSRENNLNALADIIAQENRLKGIYCHTQGHELAGESVKVLSVACPVDVKLYSADGSLAAQVISNESEVLDELVSCFVFEDGKLFAVPSNLEFNIEITATENGSMDYSVFEYTNGSERREISFSTQVISENDTFCGATGTQATEETSVYSLLKNNTDVISSESVTLIEATGVTIDSAPVSLDIGNEISLSATVNTTGDSNVKWKSSDESICTINNTGVLTAVSAGETIIYAVSIDGGYIDTLSVTVNEHDYDEGTYITSPTCTTDGVQVFTCKNCGETKTEIIAALQHSFGEWEVITKPTCNREGLEQRVCENDSTHIESQVIAKTEHVDIDGDSYCDNCRELIADNGDGKNEHGGNTESNACKWCGKIHTGFFGKFVGFFHKIAYFFAHLFGKR